MLKFEIRKKNTRFRRKKNKWTQKLLKWLMLCEVVNDSKKKKYFLKIYF